MTKGRNPSSGGQFPQLRPVRLGVVLVLMLGCLLASCQKDTLLKPGAVQTDVITATYIHPVVFNFFPIEIDGKIKDTEWGGPLDTTRPYTNIRLSAEEGAGFPGDPIYLAMKAAYTDTDLFLLFVWPDPAPDEMKDALHYIGPDLSCLPERCPDLRDNNNPKGFPSLVSDASWTQNYLGLKWDEDRLYLAFEMSPARDDRGAFDVQGCQVACHPGQQPQFGRLTEGRLDVWQWLAARTNHTRDLYVITDNPAFPKFGIPAFLEDGYADPTKGLSPDPGKPTWYQNWESGSTVPLYVYRPADDGLLRPNSHNRFLEVGHPNNLLPYYYIWRENLLDLVSIPRFSALDSVNYAVLPQGQEARKWRPGTGALARDDAVGGYFYSYPSGSRADVRGKAVWSDGFWTLEVARPLNTGDTVNDVTFRFGGTPTNPEPPADVVFTAGVADNSSDVHWGSVPQILRFGPIYTLTITPTKEGSQP
jgi:hypothetical protein